MRRRPHSPRCRQAGSSHGIVELVDFGENPFQKKAPGFGKPDAACVAFKEEDA